MTKIGARLHCVSHLMKSLISLSAALCFPLVVLAQTHCHIDEVDYFSCRLRDSGKILSLCGGRLTPNQEHGMWLQYRVGQPGAIEMAFPEQRKESVGKFESNYFSPRGEDHDVTSLRFINRDAFYDLSLAEYPSSPRASRLRGGVSAEAKGKSSYYACLLPIRAVYLQRFRALNTYIANTNEPSDFMADFYRRKSGQGG
jgi:hypothetical protein